jgi:hypothetical protein
MKYRLDLYILFRINSVFKGLMEELIKILLLAADKEPRTARVQLISRDCNPRCEEN